jgi:ArsR family transcriptional regulator
VTAPIQVRSPNAAPAGADLAADAHLLAAVADPTRLTILTALAEGTTGVRDLQAHVPVAPNLLSYHLKVLRDAGLVIGVRRSRRVDYTLTPDALDRLHAALPVPARQAS